MLMFSSCDGRHNWIEASLLCNGIKESMTKDFIVELLNCEMAEGC